VNTPYTEFMRRQVVFNRVSLERGRQDYEYGEYGGLGNMRPGERLSILAEEVGEVAKEVNELSEPGAQQRLREELVQVAAVAVAWIQVLDSVGEDSNGR
jgi:hypothetical protein